MVINKHGKFTVLVCLVLLIMLSFSFVCDPYFSAAAYANELAGTGVLLTCLVFLGVTIEVGTQSAQQYLSALLQDLYDYVEKNMLSVSETWEQVKEELDDFFYGSMAFGQVAVSKLNHICECYIKQWVINRIWKDSSKYLNDETTTFSGMIGPCSLFVGNGYATEDRYYISGYERTINNGNTFMFHFWGTSNNNKVGSFYTSNSKLTDGAVMAYVGVPYQFSAGRSVSGGDFELWDCGNPINHKVLMDFKPTSSRETYINDVGKTSILNLAYGSPFKLVINPDYDFYFVLGSNVTDIVYYSAAAGKVLPYDPSVNVKDIFLSDTVVKSIDCPITDALLEGKSIDDVTVLGQDAILGDAGEVIDFGNIAILGVDALTSALSWADALAKLGAIVVDDAVPNAGSVVLNPSGVADGTLAGELSVAPPDIEVPDVNTNILQKILTALLSIPTILSDILDMLKHFFDVSEFKLDFSGFKTLVIKDKFPFCIPFDFLKAVKIFYAPASNFNLRIDLDTQYFSCHHAIDISSISIYIKFFRFVASVWYIMFLTTRTREFIKW